MNIVRISILILSLFLCGCFDEKKIITSGNYGPLKIGDRKSIVLEKVETLVSTSSIQPVVSEAIYLESPTINDLQELNNEDGILIWVNKHPFPLRVEFTENKVVKTWGATNNCIALKDDMNVACKKTYLISNTINIGDSRESVYLTITNNQTDLAVQVGNFVPGYQEFRISHDIDEIKYKELLLKNNTWQFSALKSLSTFKDPFYSRITIFFKNDKLFKIVHWSSQYELP